MKYILFIIGLMSAYYVNAQSFSLTPNGFVDSINNNNTYIVVPFEGNSQEDIYNNTLRAIEKNFSSLDYSINKEENKRISYNSVLPKVTYRTPLGTMVEYDLYYSLVFEFKDNRMKINAPHIIEIKSAPINISSVPQPAYMYINETNRGAYIFKKNGKIKSQFHKENIETAVNSYIRKIINDINNTSDIETKEEDW